MTDIVRYCLDANIFISAKNGPYGFDIVPSFWQWIDRTVSEGKIYSSIFVCDELCKGTDYLAGWAKERRSSGLFVEPSKSVQEAYGLVAERVLAMYEPYSAQPFLDGADPWSISHGIADGSTLVSFEALVSPRKTIVKIPNICQVFGIRPVSTYTMLRECGARF